MAHSKKPKSNNILSTVRHVLDSHIKPCSHFTVALSGGVDSVVLLDVFAILSKEMAFTLSAVHVNHGISRHATHWSRFCCDLCHHYGIPIHVAYLKLGKKKGESLEAVARRERYRIFHSMQSDHVVLAQHIDDQAETFMLQLLRGAGIKGLSSMPLLRNQRTDDTPTILRPLLAITRDQIEAYAQQNQLRWIDDESNDNTLYDRNFLRHEIFPTLKQRYPSYPKVLHRASCHLAEAASLLDELAELDRKNCFQSGRLEINCLRKLSFARAKNLLRYTLFQQGMAPPNTRKLEEILRQILVARSDSQCYVSFGNTEIRCFQGSVIVQPRKSLINSNHIYPWCGEKILILHDLEGTIRFIETENQGIDPEKIHHAPAIVRLRKGGERFKPHCNRPHRSLKNLLQEATIPPWQRNKLPLLFCDEKLVWVPGIGIDCEFQVKSGKIGIVPVWDSNS